MRTDASEQEHAHVRFLAASLLLGVVGGFTLAVTLPVQAALGRFDLGWVSHAQVHGHLQVVGFAGFFVLGMALRLAPRFGRGDVAWLRAVRPAFFLLLAGVLLRAIGQPLADHDAFAAMLIAGVVAELAGALVFVAVFAGTLAPSLRGGQPHALLLCSASVWLAVQAALGAWWLTELAVEGGVILEQTRNSALVNIQFFGVLLSAILGVGMRAFPTFFGMPAPHRAMSLGVWVLLNVGVALWTVAAVLRAEAGAVLGPLAGAGALAVGLAIIGAVITFGVGRWKHRMAAASRGFVWALQPMLVWLALTGAGLAWAGVRAAVDGGVVGTAQIDAVRHVFALGVVTLGITTIAQLMLPEFASERLVSKPAAWRGAAFGLALSVAAVLRGVLPWAGLADDQRYWGMATGGVIALVAVAAFGALYWRARRRHLAYTARIAATRARAAGLPTVG